MQPILKVISYVILFFLLTNFTCSISKSIVYATQKDVLVLENNNNNQKENPCKKQMNYTPDVYHTEHTPIRYLKVNVHIVDHPNRKYNFDDEAGRIYAQGLINNANQKLMQNKQMHLPVNNQTPVLPVRLQLILTPDPSIPGDDGIYFNQDSSIWYLNKKDKRGLHGLYSDTLYRKFGVQKEKVLNIFMLEHHPDSIASPTYKNASNGIGKSYYVKISNNYFDYKQTKAGKAQKGTWFAAGLLVHEIGHSLGLLHSWTRNDGCDDTPPHPNCWENGEPPCDKMISNNIMDYNKYANALTPCQIAKMHYNMSKDKSSQRKLLRQDWCSYHLDKTISINENEKVEWFSSKDVLGDIIVKRNAELTIHCSLSMPINSRIKLHPGSKLIVNNGKIFNRCGDEWKGIELVVQDGTSKGQIILYGDAVIADTANGVEIEPVLD